MLNKARLNQVLFNGRVAYVAKLVALTGSLVVSGFASADVQIDKPFAASVTSNVTVLAPLEKQAPLAAAVHATVTSQPELAQSTNLGAVIDTSATLVPIDPIILNVVRSSVDVTATVADVEIEQTTPVSAVAPAVAEASGVFDLAIPIAGQASVEVTVDPLLIILVELDGQSSLGGLQASGTLSGSVDLGIPLAAQAATEASATGLFELEIPLGADALIEGAAAGDVHLDIPLDGYSDIGGIQAVGTLEADLGLTVNIEAATNVTALSGGGITLEIPVAVDAIASSATTGDIHLDIPIDGVAQTTAAADADVHITVNLDGQSDIGGLQASGTLAGGVSLDIPLAAQVLTEAETTGGIHVDIPLDATANGSAVADADVHITVNLDGQSDIGGIQAVGTLEADINITVNLDAVTDVAALSSGYIKLDIPVAVDALASAAATGGIHLDIPIGGTADTAASADADVHITVNLDGQSSLGGIQATASLDADVDLTKPLGVAVLGPVTATADIHLTKKPSAGVDAIAVTAGNVHLTIPVATNAEAAAEIDNSKLRVIKYYDDLLATVDVDGVAAAYAVIGGIEATYEIEDASANWEIETVEAAGISYLLQAA